MPKLKNNPARCQSTPTQVHPHSRGCSENASADSHHSEPPRNVGLSIDTHMNEEREAEADLGFDEEVVAESPLAETSKRRWKTEWTVDVIDENGAKKQKSLSVKGLIALEGGERVLTQWNSNNQPVGDSGGLLGGFIGHLASNFNNFPIIYKTWHKVPTEYKNNVYNNVVKKKFVVDDGKQKDYIISNMAKKWRDNKCRLFHSNYKPELRWEENVNLHPSGINKEHWATFLEHRLSAEGQALSEKNSANRKRQTIPHTLGSKTLVRKKHELEADNGRKYSRGEMYQISHKRKDGSFVNEEAQKISEELEREIEQGTPENEAYNKVFGKEHPGYVRGMGFGVCPSQMPGSSSQSTGCSKPDGPSREEYDSLKLQLKLLQEQVNFLMSQPGNQNLSGFPSNQVTDLASDSSHQSAHPPANP